MGFKVGQQDAASGVLRFGATVEADAATLWYVLHDRQQALELGRLRNAYRVTQGGDLVADALKGIAEIASVDDKATSDGCALGLIADELDVHKV